MIDLPPPAAPRVVDLITVKRNVPLTGRSYGHWWVEVEDESYGWWPGRDPLRLRDILVGVPGVLNGLGISPDGTPTRDPNHGLVADYEFHPVLVRPRTDDELACAVRTFAWGFSGEWRWAPHPTMNCRLFQLALFDAVGLVDGTGNYRTRGPGCPVLQPVRRAVGRVSGRRRWPRNLPAPGQRVADVMRPQVGCPAFVVDPG